MQTGGRLVVHQSHFKDLTHSQHWRFDRVGRDRDFRCWQFETCRLTLRMSVDRGGPEVVGAQSVWRE
jgi:hypothetical protein